MCCAGAARLGDRQVFAVAGCGARFVALLRLVDNLQLYLLQAPAECTFID